MGLFSRFEDKAESVIEGSAARGKGGIEPVKLAKRAFKEMQREKMVGVGQEYAPTLYNVLISPEDDARMSGYYPSMAGEIETYLSGKAKTVGLVFDCPPLVRFIVDDGLKRGRFDIIAESVSPAIIADLREEEMEHYGIKRPKPTYDEAAYQAPYESGPMTKVEPGFDPLSDPAQEYRPDYEPQPAAPAAQDTPERPQRQKGERTYPPTEIPSQPDAESEPAPSAADVEKTVFVGAPVPAQPQAALYDYASKARHIISGPRAIIGRGSACDVIVSDPSVSRHHAEILHDEAGWLIRDTGSTNGTSVNGSRTSQSPIYPGDVISLGTAELEFQEA